MFSRAETFQLGLKSFQMQGLCALTHMLALQVCDICLLFKFKFQSGCAVSL